MFFDGIFEKQLHVDFYHYRKFNSVKNLFFYSATGLGLMAFMFRHQALLKLTRRPSQLPTAQ